MNVPDNPNRPTSNSDKGGSPSAFVKYSGIGIQMLATIGAGVYAGMKLDAWQENKTPGWTIGLSLLAIFASLYLFIKQLPKN